MICLESLGTRPQLHTFPCGKHTAHVDCANAWLKTSSRCPMCRVGGGKSSNVEESSEAPPTAEPDATSSEPDAEAAFRQSLTGMVPNSGGAHGEAQLWRGPCAHRCGLCRAACASADGKYVCGCVPAKPVYVLPCCLHACVCPQQGCAPVCVLGRSEDSDRSENDFLRCLLRDLHLTANASLCCVQYDCCADGSTTDDDVRLHPCCWEWRCGRLLPRACNSRVNFLFGFQAQWPAQQSGEVGGLGSLGVILGGP